MNLEFMGQRSESMVGGTVLKLLKTERSFSLNFLFTSHLHYAKRKHIPCICRRGVSELFILGVENRK